MFNSGWEISPIREAFAMLRMRYRLAKMHLSIVFAKVLADRLSRYWRLFREPRISPTTGGWKLCNIRRRVNANRHSRFSLGLTVLSGKPLGWQAHFLEKFGVSGVVVQIFEQRFGVE